MLDNKYIMNINNNYYRFLIIIVFLILAILISILVYSKIINTPIITGSLTTKIEDTLTPTKPVLKPTFGSMTIKTADGKVRYPVTDYLKFEVMASSQQRDIVGYDVLIGLEGGAFEIIKVESDLANFNLFKMEKENRLTITGAKKLNATAESLFLETKVLTLTLKPLKSGKFSFKLLSEIGKEKTQLVDTGSNVYFPKVNNIEIEIY